MPDYGHDLQFGTFLTPSAADADRVVELAALTEVAGLDLVTVQDHPYQARFLDVWALLATVLARTSSVRVAPNVVNLPLRPPFVLAKTVASLDVLSNGRVELGLGAGGFWDAIAAAGGPRRKPGEALAALAEGIEIIRAAWDVDARSVRVEGEHYRVSGVHPGPAPAHPVQIWLGAIGPKMLELTGRVADGWLPSMSYVPPDTLAERNAIIDAAADAAGRAANRRAAALQRQPVTGRRPARAHRQRRRLGRAAGRTDADARHEHLHPGRRRPGRDQPVRRRGGAGGAGTGRGAAGRCRGRRRVRGPRTPTAGFAVAATPDDGIRRSEHQPWDESTRPQYSLPDTADEYTAHDQAVAQHLVDVHDHLRAELTQLLQVIEQVAAGSVGVGQARSLINTMTMRQNNWTLGAFCESYCRVVTTHHSLEDASVFPHLRRRDADLGPVLDRLESEHHVIAAVLDDVDRALVGLVSSPDGMSGLRAAVDLLSDTLLSHLAYEERMLLEPLARYGFY